MSLSLGDGLSLGGSEVRWGADVVKLWCESRGWCCEEARKAVRMRGGESIFERFDD